MSVRMVSQRAHGQVYRRTNMRKVSGPGILAPTLALAREDCGALLVPTLALALADWGPFLFALADWGPFLVPTLALAIG